VGFIIPLSTTTQGYLNLKSYAEFAKAGSALVEHKISASPPKPDICALMSTKQLKHANGQLALKETTQHANEQLDLTNVYPGRRGDTQRSIRR